MTIRQMLKKIDTYNEVAKATCEKPLELRVTFNNGCSEIVKTYRDFRKYLNHEYVKECADVIAKYDGYEFCEDAVITAKLFFGEEIVYKVNFFPCRVW